MIFNSFGESALVSDVSENTDFPAINPSGWFLEFDFRVLLLPRASLALAMYFATGTTQTGFPPLLDLRHRDAFTFHPQIVVEVSDTPISRKDVESGGEWSKGMDAGLAGIVSCSADGKRAMADRKGNG